MNYTSMLKRTCPKCQKGHMFTGWFKMNANCPVCGMKFEREAGYYTGAMFISWFFQVFIVGPVCLTMMFTGFPLWQTLLVSAALLVIFTPLFFQYSRVIWLYLDFTIFHPE